MWIVTLYVPAAVLVALVIVLFSYRGTAGKVILTLPIPWANGPGIEITSRLAVRMLLVASIALCGLWYMLFDYSSLFPTHLDMDVFFDAEGLRHSLESLNEDMTAKIGYEVQDFNQRSRYFEECDEKLKTRIDLPEFFTSEDALIHSIGYVEFNVVKSGGFQEYYIESAPGELTHELDRPGQSSAFFSSRFEKLPSGHDHVLPSLAEIFTLGVVLQPRFKQILVRPGTPEEFDHVLMAVTRVRFFPVPKVFNTIFFLVLDDGLSVAPIAYTAYRY